MNEKATEYKMRRFTMKSAWRDEIIHDGIVFPDGQVVVQMREWNTLHIFKDMEFYQSKHGKAAWIDAEVTP